MPQQHHQPSTTPLSATIVLYRSDLAQLRATIASVGRACEGLEGGLRLFLVDQSQDPIYATRVAQLARDFETMDGVALELICRDSNGGYGAGHNAVPIDQLGELHLVLNPDVVLSPGMLSLWQQTLRHHQDVAALAPRGFNANGDEEFLAKRYPSVLVLCLRAFAPPWLQRRFASRLHHYELRDLPTQGLLQDVPLLSGCCILIRANAWRSVGGFDERFFLYFEDYDLCQRLRKQGRIVRDPSVTVVHHGGQAARKGWRHIRWFVGGGLRFFSKWGWRWV